jgi:Amt family ammonium transporter
MANTFLATAAAGVSWTLFETLFKKKATLLGFCSGVVAGLVAITPASGFAGPMGAIVLGVVVAPICLFAVSTVKSMLGYDDALDVFGIHCVGGIVGALATGILVSPMLGGAGIVDYTTCGLDGDFSTCDALATYTMSGQLVTQATAVGVTLLLSGVISFVLFLVLRLLGLFRMPPEKEVEGLDIVSHGEAAYHP